MTDPWIELNEKYAKDGMELLVQKTPLKAHLDHMVVGMAGEAGELGDAIKRYTMYNKPIDRANVVEELADLRFYMAGVMRSFNITEDELVAQERTKLGVRYASGGYSDQQAQDRADKVDATIIGKIDPPEENDKVGPGDLLEVVDPDSPYAGQTVLVEGWSHKRFGWVRVRTESGTAVTIDPRVVELRKISRHEASTPEPDRGLMKIPVYPDKPKAAGNRSRWRKFFGMS